MTEAGVRLRPSVSTQGGEGGFSPGPLNFLYMRIGIIGSMQFTEKMIEARDELIRLGHDAFLTDLHKNLVGKTDEEKR